MATSYGLLTSYDSDRSYVSSVGKDVVYDEITKVLERHNKLQAEMLSVFVERRTADYAFRYKAPIGGEMQTMGRQAPAGAVKATGYWDVGLPLTQIGDRLATDRVDAGYLTAGALEAQLRSIMDRDTNSVRRDIMAALLYDKARIFSDPIWGNVTVRPLASDDDAVVYPPVIGAQVGATDDHYLTAATLNVAAMTAAYNDLIEHFGQMQSGDNVICFAGPTDVATIAGLDGYTSDVDRFLVAGDDTASLSAIPNAPGITVGRWNSVWVNEWRWMPDDYVLFIHLDFPKPLYMREDPSDTGLGTGLQLVSTDTEHPITNAHYEHRYGFGVANRLNGVVLNITAGDYTVPSYADFFRYASA